MATLGHKQLAQADRQRKRETLADRQRGSLDGHGRVPALTDIAPFGQPVQLDTVFAPYAEAVGYEGRSSMEAEHVAHHRRIAGAREACAQLDEDIAAGEEAVRRGQPNIERAALPLTPEELAPRNPAESGRDADWLRRRREVMRARRIARAELELQQAIATLDALRSQRARAGQTIQNDLAATRSLARQLAERVAARVAAYWQGVASTHPDGKHLASIVPPMTPELPDWVTARPENGEVAR